MKKVLVYGAYNANNLGDDLMQVVINDVLTKNGISVDYFDCIDKNNYFKEARDFHYISNPVHPASRNVVKQVLELLNFDEKKYKKYDAIIFMGGGYTYEKFGLKKLLKWYYFANKIRRKNKTRIFFTGQTAGPALTELGERIILDLYRQGDFVGVRERDSYNFLRENDISCELVGDDAFLLCRKMKCDEERSTKKVGSKYVIMNYKSFPDYDNQKEKVFKFYLEIARRLKYEIVVVPFRNDVNDSEYRINTDLCQYLKENGIEASFKTFDNVDDLSLCFKSSEGVIGTAYHLIVLGLIYSKKVFAFYSGNYYERKIRGVLDLYNIAETNSIGLEKINDDTMLSFVVDNFRSNKPSEAWSKEIAGNVADEWGMIIKTVSGDK